MYEHTRVYSSSWLSCKYIIIHRKYNIHGISPGLPDWVYSSPWILCFCAATIQFILNISDWCTASGMCTVQISKKQRNPQMTLKRNLLRSVVKIVSFSCIVLHWFAWVVLTVMSIMVMWRFIICRYGVRRLIGRDSLVISRNTGEPALMMMMIILGNIDDQHRNPNMNNKDHVNPHWWWWLSWEWASR